MNTLVDFITHTKGLEYLIAIAFLISFIIFWQMLHRQGVRFWVTILPIVALVLVFGILGLRINSQRPSEGVAVGESPFLTTSVLAEWYGPASFDHSSHPDHQGDCGLCHHYSQGRIPSCSECHGKPFDAAELKMPGLTHAYHLRCIGCHMENQAGPTNCVECHTQAEIPPLSAVHPLTGVTNCLSCHGENGIPGVTRVPADHLQATNGVCQLCHKPRVEAKDFAGLPHTLAGREGCLMCHGAGIAGASKVLENHTGRTNETCTLCHKPL
ncbi:MAG: hypothetical protein A2Z21_02935 [Candidatus Fraserbacteria bacterium RBG_16_55_9]|uniref:Class III cytochrome C domain-containing protein n=1 Tax=Fraserbacteria sp. (strain RBG_16_55_9) TaxID=1817864 RepID=A0A1F5UYL2_FRAXR|nr:MAG: hypothetical protein A2Z21_02935 [Candidatus Fraserbacteria bacterium RBG_16_55_9]